MSTISKVENNVNVTNITLFNNLKAEDITISRIKSITSCQTFLKDTHNFLESGIWKLVDAEEKELPSTSLNESLESLCVQKPHFLILPNQGHWPGKEKCNALSGKLYLFKSIPY